MFGGNEGVYLYLSFTEQQCTISVLFKSTCRGDCHSGAINYIKQISGFIGISLLPACRWDIGLSLAANISDTPQAKLRSFFKAPHLMCEHELEHESRV